MQEKISALLDDELDLAEQEEVLRYISEDESLSATWQRYHLIRAAVRNESIAHIPGFSERLSTVLFEDKQRVQELPQRGSWIAGKKRGSSTAGKKWVPGFALAASIAGLLAFSFFATQSGVNTQPVKPVNIAQIDQSTRWETATPALENALNTFMVEHGEFTPMSSMNGLMSYARFVSYDTSE